MQRRQTSSAAPWWTRARRVPPDPAADYSPGRIRLWWWHPVDAGRTWRRSLAAAIGTQHSNCPSHRSVRLTQQRWPARTATFSLSIDLAIAMQTNNSALHKPFSVHSMRGRVWSWTAANFSDRARTRRIWLNLKKPNCATTTQVRGNADNPCRMSVYCAREMRCRAKTATRESWMWKVFLLRI